MEYWKVNPEKTIKLANGLMKKILFVIKVNLKYYE
jgi:hypothetical protein